MQTAMTLIRLGRCPGWSASSLDAHAILLVLSFRGSYVHYCRSNQHMGEDSDNPAHPRNLIRDFTAHMNKLWIPGFPFSSLHRLIRLGWCPGWSESWMGTQIILLGLTCSSSNYLCRRAGKALSLLVKCTVLHLLMHLKTTQMSQLMRYGSYRIGDQ